MPPRRRRAGPRPRVGPGLPARGTTTRAGARREPLAAPRRKAAATKAGRPAPRIVAGLPVAVHDDVAEARAAAAATATSYAGLANYQRVLEAGGVGTPA